MSKVFAVFLAGTGVLGPVVLGSASSSWMVGRFGFDANALSAFACADGGVAFVAFLLAAASVARLGVPAGWWRPVAIVGASFLGLLALVCLSPSAVVVLAADAIVVALALRTPPILAIDDGRPV